MYHMEQTEENAKMRVLGVPGAQGVALSLSLSLVALNVLQENHFSPDGFALFHEKSASLCHYDE